MTVLFLRGPQTPGELRSRTERLYSFPSLQEVETCLEGLCAGDAPLVQLMPARPGQKERRYAQLLSGEPEWEENAQAGPMQSGGYEEVPVAESVSRLQLLEEEVGRLKEELQQLREEFTTFKAQF